MKNYQLILKLLKLPMKAEVKILYDGASRANLDKVWLSKEHKIVVSDDDENIYYDRDKPIGE